MPSIRVLYKQYVLQDYKYLLRHRSLLARGRALLGPQTPEVVARLFGGRVDPAKSRRATRRQVLYRSARRACPTPRSGL